MRTRFLQIALDPNAEPGAGAPPAEGQQPPAAPDVATLVTQAVARERAAFEAEKTRLTTELETLRAKQKPEQPPAGVDEAYIASLRKPLEDQLATLTERQSKREARLITSELAKAASDSVDPDDVAERLRPFVRLNDDDQPEVIDSEGRPRYGKNGPMTLAELAVELYTKKPYLQKSGARAGAGLGHLPADGNIAGSQKEALKAQIAALEKEGKFAEAAPLKTQLMRLASSAASR